MRLGPAIALAAGIALLGTIIGPVEHRAGAATRPDIVVIYVDDWSPKTPWLWSKRSRTPTLAKIVREGTRLKHANASTPKCCPARANTLSGQWSHNNRVTTNEMAPYDPAGRLPVKLSNRGYDTFFAGKYLNKFQRRAPRTRDARRAMRGWKRVAAQWTDQGKFYNYPVWTRNGVERYGDRPRDHSTEVFTKRTAKWIRKTRRDVPIFAFLSLFDGHKPNVAMPRHQGHRACRGVRRYDLPSFNEADVSDKPRYVRRAGSVPRRAGDLRVRCEEMLSVEWAARRILAALQDTGRQRNTLLVFTSDNGVLFGDHRLTGKAQPYSSPIVMYMRWPARWGKGGRTIEEPVSNVDLAPTFCAIAGCAMPAADGLDLLPLLDGDVDALDRRFIYNENLLNAGKSGLPCWREIRTTRKYSRDRAWIYTEYDSGERELYDLMTDPHQLRNRADDEGLQERVSKLRALLHDEVIRPNDVRCIGKPPYEI